tara:strand:- start:1535 stop:1831 length:297 start_codon:yes stop_codon:yes gene_type:complete
LAIAGGYVLVYAVLPLDQFGEPKVPELGIALGDADPRGTSKYPAHWSQRVRLAQWMLGYVANLEPGLKDRIDAMGHIDREAIGFAEILIDRHGIKYGP